MKSKIILILILLCAILLRLYNLGKAPFWEDELLTLYRINMPPAAIFRTTIPFFTHPPLFYLLLNAWVKLTGVNEFTLRFLPFAFSVLSVFMIFKLGEIIYNRRIGLYAALLLAFSPFDIYYAQEAKNYSMSWALGLISFWLFYRLIKNFSSTNFIAYILVTLVSWYTSYTAIIYSFLQGICVFIFFKPRHIAKWFGAYLYIIILYLPWFNLIWKQTRSWHAIKWIPATSNYFLKSAQFIGELLYLFPLNAANERILPVSLSFCAILVALALVEFRKNNRFKFVLAPEKKDIMLLVWIISPLAAYYLIDKFWFNIFGMQRYFALVLIPLLILLSKGINRFRFGFQLLIILFIVSYAFTGSVYPYYLSGKKICDERWGNALNTIKRIDRLQSAVVIPISPEPLDYYKSNLRFIGIDDDKTCVYKNRDFKSIFVISRTVRNISVVLPKYILHNEWQEGSLNVKWYKIKK